ncbi:TlpA disulfide reductase family protein [Telluribacter sp.]|jgi:thiol-disulfide isomerase/thioredoxin|uniref:TlpA disulfide reductase family protein n=1 Tax=Telluribacter sp. TaxID=1978767 RepID=UPI002E13F844|nr:TlpA disulfide reductase family protein [Telluribacter sp.]
MIFYKKLWLSLLVMTAPGCFAQHVRVIKYNQLNQLLSTKNDTILIVNFWATWCKPCIEELPYFEKLQARHARDKVKVLLVSLDFKSQLEKKVKPFLSKTGISTSQVVLLDETDPGLWMEKVATDWSGALPFTLFIHRKKGRKDYERPFTLAELETELRSFIK